MFKRGIVTILVAAAAFVGAAAPAQAHHGDWWQQYLLTRERAVANCEAFLNSTCDSDHVTLTASGAISDHARRFVFRMTGGGRFCAGWWDIGHTYGIFDSDLWCSFNSAPRMVTTLDSVLSG